MNGKMPFSPLTLRFLVIFMLSVQIFFTVLLRQMLAKQDALILHLADAEEEMAGQLHELARAQRR